MKKLTDSTQRYLGHQPGSSPFLGGHLSHAQEGEAVKAWQIEEEPGFLTWWPGRKRERQGWGGEGGREGERGEIFLLHLIKTTVWTSHLQLLATARGTTAERQIGDFTVKPQPDHFAHLFPEPLSPVLLGLALLSGSTKMGPRGCCIIHSFWNAERSSLSLPQSAPYRVLPYSNNKTNQHSSPCQT